MWLFCPDDNVTTVTVMSSLVYCTSEMRFRQRVYWPGMLNESQKQDPTHACLCLSREIIQEVMWVLLTNNDFLRQCGI